MIKSTLRQIQSTLHRYRNTIRCKAYYSSSLTSIDSLIKNIWPSQKFNFTKKTFKYRVEEELFIFDKFQNYLEGTTFFIDVGANVGMTSLAFHFFSQARGEIIAIEPLASCSDILTNIANTLPCMTYIAGGVGAENTSGILNVGKNSPTSQASSFLRFTPEYTSKFNYATVGYRQNTVPISRLDTLIDVKQIANKRTFLHIDVEGFEYKVLQGASGLLPYIDIIVIESGVNLFEGQRSINDIVILLNDTHELIGTLGAPMMAGGDILVQDYLFIRKVNE